MEVSNRNIVQADALAIAMKNKRCGLGISMGVGKTRIAIEHLQRHFNPFIKALVVIPKKSVMKSWFDELNKMNSSVLEDHITFTTYLSLNKQNPNEYDVVYLDECHSLLPNHENFLSNYTGKILGLTGTPPKNKTSEKGMLVQKYCPIKYVFTVDDATDSNILNDYNYVTSRLEQSQTPKQIQFGRIMRMRALMDYTSKESYVNSILKNINAKCIVFANTQKQADRICKHSYHSKNSKSDENPKP